MTDVSVIIDNMEILFLTAILLLLISFFMNHASAGELIALRAGQSRTYTYSGYWIDVSGPIASNTLRTS